MTTPLEALKALHEVCERMDLEDQDARPTEEEYQAAMAAAARVIKDCRPDAMEAAHGA